MDTTSGGWLIDWYNQKCIQDCEPSNGPPCQAHDNPETKIFDTPQQYCTAIFWVDSNICVADSLHIDSFTNKWCVNLWIVALSFLKLLKLTHDEHLPSYLQVCGLFDPDMCEGLRRFLWSSLQGKPSCQHIHVLFCPRVLQC